MEEIRSFNDVSRNHTTIPMVSPIPFDTSPDQYYFSPISNQLQRTSPDMYWQYPNDHPRSPYPNGFNSVGQYHYWRHSPYPTGDQMPMREWSTSSPDQCNYQMPPWSMEAVSMVSNHGMPHWSTARTSLDFSGAGDASINDVVIPPEFARVDDMSLEQENKSYCSNFTASSWQQSNCAPLIIELLKEEQQEEQPEEPRNSSCRWQSDERAKQYNSDSEKLQNKTTCGGHNKSPELSNCKEEINENINSTDIQKDSIISKDNPTAKKTPRKRHSKPSRKPEAYDRQKKVQRERENLIRNAIQRLNLILPDDNKGKKLSKNLVLAKAIEHIKTLKEKLGNTPIKDMEVVDDKTKYNTHESPHKKTKRLKGIASKEAEIRENDEGQSIPAKVSCNQYENPPTLPNLSSSSSPPKLAHSPIVSKKIHFLPSTSSASLSHAATHDYNSADKDSMMLNLLQDPAILTPSDTSSGSERAESPATNDEEETQGESLSHVKRPMNAFLLFSKSNREHFKRLYPGKDNRRISTILGDHWNTMKAEEKQPFQEMARELMRKTKETYPNFKYSPTDQSSKVDAFGCCGRDSPRNGTRVGNHSLRSRQSKKREKDSSVSSGGNLSSKEIDITDYNAEVKSKLLNGDLSTTKSKRDKKENANYLLTSKHQANRREKGVKVPRDNTRYSCCDNWVQCDQCKKWWMLQDNVNLDELPDKWFCWINADPRVNNCQAQELDGLEVRKQEILKDGDQ